ncbi:hypothetical protein Stok01_01125 [Sulfurisphaera tokodaii]
MISNLRIYVISSTEKVSLPYISKILYDVKLFIHIPSFQLFYT